jgi:hypothetical protein
VGTLPILTRNNRHGTVFVQDERPEGTILVLTCRDGDKGGGIAVEPQRPKIWPMFLAMEAEGIKLEDVLASDFRLVLDTTELPVGRLEFGLGQFVDQVEKKLEERVEVVHLDRKEASQWGLRVNEVAP